MAVRIEDRSAMLRQRLQTHAREALAALGAEAVACVGGAMDARYGRPIRDTGALRRDLSFQVRDGELAVDVGNSLPYAAAVHEGTARMPGRPYLRDGLADGQALARLGAVLEARLGQGLD